MSLINSTIQRYLTVALTSLASSTYAIQPLSEEDMGEVSFDSGIELINIYGAPSAGLEDDVEITSTKPANSDKEIETASVSATEIVEDNEIIDELNQDLVDFDEEMTFEEIELAIAEGTTTLGSANFLDTNSEISYRNSAFMRDAEFFESGGIRQSRDLYIDQLKFENIRGDYQDSDRTVGDIFLSDWQSRGSTQITAD